MWRLISTFSNLLKLFFAYWVTLSAVIVLSYPVLPKQSSSPLVTNFFFSLPSMSFQWLVATLLFHVIFSPTIYSSNYHHHSTLAFLAVITHKLQTAQSDKHLFLAQMLLLCCCCGFLPSPWYPSFSWLLWQHGYLPGSTPSSLPIASWPPLLDFIFLAITLTFFIVFFFSYSSHTLRAYLYPITLIAQAPFLTSTFRYLTTEWTSPLDFYTDSSDIICPSSELTFSPKVLFFLCILSLKLVQKFMSPSEV